MDRRDRAGRRRMANAAWTVVVGLVLALSSTPTAAQIHRTAIGVTGGVSWSGDLTPGVGFETIMEDGWIAGAQLETWFPSRWIGVRLNASYADRFVQDSDSRFRIMAGDAGLVFRLLPPRRDRVVAPIVGLGAGVVFYKAEAHALPLAEGVYGDDPVMRVMVAPSIGVDLFPDALVGLRVEVADKIVFPSIGESPEAEGTPRVHNPRVRAALQLRLGRPPPAPIAARAPTEADPAPEPMDPLEPVRESPEPAEPDPAPPPEMAPGAVPLTVQVGAFVDAGSAAEWADGVRRMGAPVRVVTVVVDGLRVNRVRVGAVADAAEAERLAGILRSAGYPTWVTTPGPGETLAADIVAATRRFMTDR